jgi:hypothetical protein
MAFMRPGRAGGVFLGVATRWESKTKAGRRRSRFADFDQHGDFKKRAHQAVLAISGPDEDRKEEETARRDEYQNLEKPPENRPQQDAPD